MLLVAIGLELCDPLRALFQHHSARREAVLRLP